METKVQTHWTRHYSSEKGGLSLVTRDNINIIDKAQIQEPDCLG